MTEQLPIINTSQNVSTTKAKSGSLLGRGLNAIQNKKTDIAQIDLDIRYREARSAYNRITDDGNQDCIGNCWSDKELAELSDAFDTFQQLANLDYGKAYFPLSQFYKGGQSVSENKTLAQSYGNLGFNWCFNNQFQNDPDIWNDLGTLYRLGDVVETDYALALYWYQKAADAGDATGMFNVSCMYEFGLGVDEDYQIVLDWQFAAAKAGHITAQYGLGCLYEHPNELLEKNDEASVFWYRKAAKNSNRKAQKRLGAMGINWQEA